MKTAVTLYRAKPAMIVLAAALSSCPGSRLMAEETIRVEACAGDPLGVARVTISFGGQAPPPIPAGVWFRVADDSGRALYPAFGGDATDASLPRATEARKTDQPALVAWFLFRGEQPFDATVSFEKGRTVRVAPVADRAKRRELLEQWWDAYQIAARQVLNDDESPATVANYLSAMLARRLGLPAPAETPAWWRSTGTLGDFDSVVGLLTGAESIRLAMQKEAVLRTDEKPEAADLPLPKAAAPPPVVIPPVPDSIEIEEIARRVPEECFYMRFGSFANFQWFRATAETWGGTLRDLVAVRGLDYGNTSRLERQLALRETVLARTLGPAVISDVAVIGTDTFIREGAALGLLLEARNAAVLRSALELQREAVAREAGARHRLLEVSGQEVSCWLTPDNRVRSFLAAQGNYLLVTNSQWLARRFLEAGAGQGALASLNEFRYARALMPLARNDAVFVHLSDPFFRNLVGPAYRVEMTRRMRAEVDLELVALARLAAACEGQARLTIAELIEGGYLPPGFGRRPDGSHPVLAERGAADSLRGARRTFLPIPDVEIAGVTSAELRGYEEFAQMYARVWTRTDPVTAAISHRPKPGGPAGREEIVVDLHVAPFPAQHYGFLAQFLGSPEPRAVRTIPGALVQIDLRLKGALLGGGEASSHFAAAAADFEPSFTIVDGRVQVDRFNDGLQRTPAFLAEVDSGKLFGILGAADRPEGFSSDDGHETGMHYYKSRTIHAVGTNLPFLKSAIDHLVLEEAARPAQLRMRIRGLAESKILGLLTAYGYAHARSISAGNLRLLDQMTQQLHVEPARAVAAAEAVLAARLVCPLGGTYRQLENDTVRGWRSSAWDPATLSGESAVPENYRFPLFDWLRALDIEFTVDAQKNILATHLEFEIQER